MKAIQVLETKISQLKQKERHAERRVQKQEERHAERLVRKKPVLTEAQIAKSKAIPKHQRFYSTIRKRQQREQQKTQISNHVRLSNIRARRKEVEDQLQAVRDRKAIRKAVHGPTPFSNAKQDPNKLSFFDLPGEIRNHIYFYAIDLRSEADSDTIYQREPFAKPLVFIQNRKIDLPCAELISPAKPAADSTPVPQHANSIRPEVQVLFNMNSLGLVNHQIRKETRSWFYDVHTFSLDLGCITPHHSYLELQRNEREIREIYPFAIFSRLSRSVWFGPPSDDSRLIFEQSVPRWGWGRIRRCIKDDGMANIRTMTMEFMPDGLERDMGRKFTTAIKRFQEFPSLKNLRMTVDMAALFQFRRRERRPGEPQNVFERLRQIEEESWHVGVLNTEVFASLVENLSALERINLHLQSRTGAGSWLLGETERGRFKEVGKTEVEITWTAGHSLRDLIDERLEEVFEGRRWLLFDIYALDSSRTIRLEPKESLEPFHPQDYH